MKTVILIGDGMGDYPCDALNGKTPLQAAPILTMRKLAAAGELFMVQTVPESLPPGSDVANLGLLGYNAEKDYTGRAPIEAAGQHLSMSSDDIAIRCNLVSIENERMKDYSAGHISTEEANDIIEALQNAFKTEYRSFHSGVSYRHLLIWENGPLDVKTIPPHDITGKEISEYLPMGKDAQPLIELMAASRKILANSNTSATQIWLWGQGKALQLKSFQELYGLKGSVISAVDLVKGLGQLAGLDVPEVEGATGFIDTNYEGKVEAAIQALESQDFVYVHVEAPDECGHMGDALLKTKAISDFDDKVVKPIWQSLEATAYPYQLIITMDHRTPVSLKSHSREPVPLIFVKGPVGAVEKKTNFDEFINDGKANLSSHNFIQNILTPK